MSKRIPIFYSAIMMTAVNLILRFASTAFQIYLSGRIGSDGIGLLQLVLSVGGLSMTAGIAGIRTATMYLTAEEIGKHNTGGLQRIISVCMRYSFVCSCFVAVILWNGASWIATRWIGESAVKPAIRLFSVFLPMNCLCGMMIGYYTGKNRIGTLAVVEVAEQLVSMSITVLLLSFWVGESRILACEAVILGSGISTCITLTCLIFLEKKNHGKGMNNSQIWKRLFHIAIPLAMADNIKSGISTVENMMVPKRLALCKEISDPLSSFGMVSGMIFPVLMFPAAILFGLAELLIPELARCNSAGSRQRIYYLAKKGLAVSVLYGFVVGGFVFLVSKDLCVWLYKSETVGIYLRRFSVLIPMLYCDSIVDAMVKGLGQQAKSVRYNIVTSAMDIFFLFILLPRYGLEGYYVSFFLTHAINLALSVRLLMKQVEKAINFRYPCIIFFVTLFSVAIASMISNAIVRGTVYFVIMFMLLCMFQIINRKELCWIRNLVCGTSISELTLTPVN